MKATVTINMDNAAFAFCDDPSLELSRILETLSKSVQNDPQIFSGYSKRILDINGNKVGDLTIDE